MAVSKVQTGLRLDEPTYKKVVHIANVESRSLNAQIEYAVKKLIADFEKSHGAIPLKD